MRRVLALCAIVHATAKFVGTHGRATDAIYLTNPDAVSTGKALRKKTQVRRLGHLESSPQLIRQRAADAINDVPKHEQLPRADAVNDFFTGVVGLIFGGPPPHAGRKHGFIYSLYNISKLFRGDDDVHLPPAAILRKMQNTRKPN